MGLIQIGETLRSAFAQLRRSWATIALITVVWGVIAYVAVLVATVALGIFVGAIADVLVLSVVGMIVFGAAYAHSADLQAGRERPLLQRLSAGGRLGLLARSGLALSMVVIALVAGLVVVVEVVGALIGWNPAVSSSSSIGDVEPAMRVLVALLSLVGGGFVAARLIFVAAVGIEEGVAGGAALRRSNQMVK